MTIGQLADGSGLPASTIRYWERVGVLPAPIRMSGQRRYARDVLHRLAVLRLAQACGLRLSEIRELVGWFRSDLAPSNRWRELARQKRIEIDEQIAKLQAMQQIVTRVMGCNRVDWNECGRLAASVLKRGQP